MAKATPDLHMTGRFHMTGSHDVPIQAEPLTVLLVDDDPDFRYLCVCALKDDENNAYRIVEAEDCQSALQAFDPDLIDCALIDYMLPDGDGCSLMNLINGANPQWFGPVLIITSGGSEEIAVDVMRAGASDYIPKQAISTASMQRALTNALEKAKLKRAVFERNEQLEATNNELEARNDEISRFYHRVSHEIKTPLTAALMFMSMLQEDVAGPVTDEQKEIVAQAMASCSELTKHFNELVECTQMDTGKLSLERRLEPLHPCVQRAIVSIAEEADSQGIGIEWSISEELPPFPMDAGRVVQILANLLGNALKFTDRGGRITLEAEPSASDSSMAEIRVTDTGVGISPEHLPRIFDRLYQIGDVGDARLGAGLGLGLTIAAELVTLHGGRIDAISEVGVGTTLTVFLPLLRTSNEPASAH